MQLSAQCPRAIDINEVATAIRSQKKKLSMLESV